MALESLYKSSTYFFTLFSFVFYIYHGVTNYSRKCKCFGPFAWREKIMVIRGHDRGFELEVRTSQGLLRIL